MLRPLSRALLIAALSLGYVALHGHWNDAFAKKHGGDDDSGGDDSGDSDDSGGGDDSDSGGDDSGGGGDDCDDDSCADDKDQPPVTAGGLYTLQTYPVNEIMRPLTMTKGITQIRAAIGTDLSSKGAFKSAGINLEGVYGYTDNFMLLGGITDAYNFKQFGVYAGFEGALAYDVVDVRVAANLHRNALPQYAVFCNPPATPDEMPVNGTCQNMNATQDSLPSGKYDAGSTRFSIDLGLPFRYAIKPQIAIVALQTLMSIDFNSVDRDFVQVTPNMAPPPATTSTVKGNGIVPDFNPSVGIATNPIPQLSVVAFIQLRVPDFDFSAGSFQVPLTGRVEFSPSQKLDIGLEFTLLNVKPPEGASPIDNRFLSIFMQSRFGK